MRSSIEAVITFGSIQNVYICVVQLPAQVYKVDLSGYVCTLNRIVSNQNIESLRGEIFFCADKFLSNRK